MKNKKDQQIENFLNSLNDNEMDRLLDAFLDLADNETDNEFEEDYIPIENQATEIDKSDRIFLGNQKRREDIATRIKTSFEENLLDMIQKYENDPLLFDIMVKATIVANEKSFKNSSELQSLSGLKKNDYYKLVDDIINEIVHQYLNL